MIGGWLAGWLAGCLLRCSKCDDEMGQLARTSDGSVGDVERKAYSTGGLALETCLGGGEAGGRNGEEDGGLHVD